MARARSIKPTFFTDGKLRKLPIAARYLFEALWCLADREGRLDDEPDDIEVFVGDLGEMSVDDALNALHPKFITRYEADGRRYIQINHFARHQRPHPKEIASTIPAAPGEITEETGLPVKSHDEPCNYTASREKQRQAGTFPSGSSIPSIPSIPSGSSGSSRRTGGGGVSAPAREAVLPGDEDNPFADGPVPEPTVEAYIANELPPMTPGNIDQLTAIQDAGMQDDAIKLAVDIAAANNRRTWAYTHAILRRWEQSGVFTAGAAKAAEAEHQRKRAPPGRASPQPALSKAEQFLELARRYEEAGE